MTGELGGRPATDVGAWGKLQTKQTATGWVARGRVKDMRGDLIQRSRVAATPEAARAAVREALADVIRAVPGADLTPATPFREYADAYLDDVRRGNFTATTYDRYDHVLRRHVLPEIGALSVERVTTRRLQLLFNQLADRGLSVSTMKGVRSAVSGAMGVAMSAQAVATNPTGAVKLKRGESAHSEVALTPADIEALLKVAREDKRIGEFEVYDFIVCMLGTGARVSEVLGLRWQDVSLGDTAADCVIRFRKNAVSVKGRGIVLQDGKTKAARREVGMIPEVREVMTRRAQHPGNYEDRPVFPIGVHDQHRDPGTMRSLLRPLYEKVPALAGIKQPTHVFRKTVATRLFDQGATATQVADLLGHSTTTLALNVYAQRRRRSEASSLSALEFTSRSPELEP